MRFIIKEQPYEQLLAAGELRYERNGRATGSVEQWRLTEAVDGYTFLRVDLDARAGESGNSWLYHATLNPAGRCEMLKYRFWGQGPVVEGNLVLEDDAAVNGRSVDHIRYEDVLALAPGYAFWFPSSVGLGLLAGRSGAHPAVTLDATVAPDAPQSAFSLHATAVTVQPGAPATLAVMGSATAVRPLIIRWAGHTRTLWLDDHDWPLQMQRDDGLTAVETRLRRVRRIAGPGRPQGS